ncbi:SagB/ThcOx family dehydrogenase [Skermania sp. ID1734]|uniref:SagB family peptide dehydrogenase n=1 Tax=Skermania sp. ID1734 TaxID=2597516 RepID=UPI001180C6FF|nr:SagB family peptide dehydrogenase [Skermania sp. ID1734]TSE01430.1 SagB/ThcOx family dehydrogenase [Skermania sp. ID1734]
MTPAESTVSLRPGARCLISATGAVLLPEKVSLTALTPAQAALLRRLSTGETVSSHAAHEPECAGLLDRLSDGGWLVKTVLLDGNELYEVMPFAGPNLTDTQELPADKPLILSKFTVLRRDGDSLVMENPRSWCDLKLFDARVLAVATGATSPADADLPESVVSQLVTDLQAGGFVVTAESIEDTDFALRSWSAHELWFHRRSTLGARVQSWAHFGPTKWASSSFPPLPTRHRPGSKSAVLLATPDLDTLEITDVTLTDAIERRASCRAYDDAAPITVDQLGELLYRCARTRGSRVVDREELPSRPYPSGGSIYELELYPVVRCADGLAQGMYHYNSFDHALELIADADHPAIERLLSPSALTLEDGRQPQVLIVIAARAGRVMWAYEQMPYALILKHVGVLTQNLYLVATAMGLGAVAQGYSDTAAFADITGTDELVECNVGAVVVGSPARH